jgi:hypothetical protein
MRARRKKWRKRKKWTPLRARHWRRRESGRRCRCHGLWKMVVATAPMAALMYERCCPWVGTHHGRHHRHL